MSSGSQNWQDGAALILKERRFFFSPLSPSAAEPPFTCQVQKGQIEIQAPAYARVRVSDGLGWKTVHDGQNWGREGISGASKTLCFLFPLSTKVRISAHGREWEVVLQTPALSGGRPSANRLSTHEWILLAASILGHGGLFIALVFLGASNDGAPKITKNFLTAERPAPVIKGGGSEAGGSGTPYIPFGGMSYSKFLNQLAAKEFAADPAAALLKSVTKLDSGRGAKRVEVGKGIKSNADGIGAGDGTGAGTGDALTGVIARQKFTAQDGGGSGADGNSKNLNDRQRALLRAKFRELQGDFQRLYSRLLSGDPSLSVTVSLETKVLPNGFLSVSSFKARGTYRPDSLQKLKVGMAEIIQNAHVGTDFSGVVLRGENVFVR